MFKKQGEFDLIQSHFAPLSQKFEGALGLHDDAALLRAGYVLSVDGFTEGVHFRPHDSAYSIGQKVLRAALSDLAAMGAKPECWFLTAAFGTRLAAEVAAFAQGCADAQARFGLHLAGGDTLRTRKGMAESFFSISVVGLATNPILRSGAKLGDRLYVSGTLGDSALGLLHPRNEILNGRYLYPEPRLDLAQHLKNFAHAAIDLSDGLLADLAHLCGASGCGAVIYEGSMPVSLEACDVSGGSGAARHLALNAGDDYELLLAVPAHKEDKLFAAAAASHTPITAIGELTAGRKIKVIDPQGKKLKRPPVGYRHFT